MPGPAAVAPVGVLAAVVAARQLLIGVRLLLAAPFHLPFTACPMRLLGVLVGHGRIVGAGYKWGAITELA